MVGIDCPADPVQRTNELNPPYPVKKRIPDPRPNMPIGNLFIEYIIRELKPLIDETFSTNPDREHTAIGGASMGGIMAFYGFLRYSATFGYSLSFSTPFFFYSKRDLRRILKIFKPNPAQHGKLTLYVGGEGHEHEFTKGVFYVNKVLRKKYRFTDERLQFFFEPEAIHHEEWWSKFALPSLRFWLKGLD